jgi:light-harvesting complex 1 alpha chain
VLALVIHFILLSTDRFNWLEGPRHSRVKTTSLILPTLPAPDFSRLG